MTVVVTALALGAVYGLVGTAVAATARATRTLHLAVGPILVAGVLVRLTLASEAVGWPDWAAVAAGVAVGATLSAVLEPLLLRRLQPGLPWLVGLAVAAGVIEAATARWLGTATLRPRPLVVVGAVGELEGPVVLALAVGAPMAVMLALLARSTRWGRRLQLVGGSSAAAARAGVDAPRVRTGVLAVTGAAAVVAGLLTAPIAFVGVGQGAGLTVRAVAAAALLGRGGALTALVGGVLLGTVEATAQARWPAVGPELAVAGLIVAVLVVRAGDRGRAWGRAW